MVQFRSCPSALMFRGIVPLGCRENMTGRHFLACRPAEFEHSRICARALPLSALLAGSRELFASELEQIPKPAVESVSCWLRLTWARDLLRRARFPQMPCPKF